jgi:hypothetical protein
MKRFGWVAALAALVCVSACTTPLIPYDRSTANTKTVGLLTPGWPSGPVAFLASNVGASFGLVGALVNASMQSNRDTDLIALLADHQIDGKTIFVNALTDDLQKEGYTVTPIAADEKRNGNLKKYPVAGANAVDAYLDVAVTNYGYMAAGISKDAPYRPWVTATVKLVSAANGSVLMQDVVTYNSFVDAKNVILISPDPAYSFPVWDDVTADKDKAAQGVSASLKQTAGTVAGLMR